MNHLETELLFLVEAETWGGFEDLTWRDKRLGTDCESEVRGPTLNKLSLLSQADFCLS